MNIKGDTTVILKHNTINSCQLWIMDKKDMENFEVIGMAKKSRNKNRSNHFHIKFMPCNVQCLL